MYDAENLIRMTRCDNVIIRRDRERRRVSLPSLTVVTLEASNAKQDLARFQHYLTTVSFFSTSSHLFVSFLLHIVSFFFLSFFFYN